MRINENIIKYGSDNLKLSEVQDTKTQELFNNVKRYFENAEAEKSKKAYTTDWLHFQNWCIEKNLDSLPANPETVMMYISDMAKIYKVSTIRRKMTSISLIHRNNGHETPIKNAKVQRTFKGIKNDKGTVQDAKKALLSDDIKKMVDALSNTLQGARDKAIILLGYAGTFRRSEIVNLNVNDIIFENEGVKIIIRKSKTDQEGAGIIKGVMYGKDANTCPVMALKNWLLFSGIVDGPIFRSFTIHKELTDKRLSSKAIALIIKRTVDKIGLNPGDFAGHSLRSGSVTQAALNGSDKWALMKQGGWKSEAMLNRYIRNADLYKNNISSNLGL